MECVAAGARHAGGHPAGASASKEATTLEDAAHIKGSPVDATDKGRPVGAAAQRAPMKTVARQVRAIFR